MDDATSQLLPVEGTSPTDPAALARLRRFGGDKLLREMIDLYLEGAPERLVAARTAVATNDLPSAELALHSLKSSSAQLGAARVGKLSERGENILRAGSMDGVAQLIGEIDAELARATTWLSSVRDGGDA
ncbi:MAG TPA: Hpt domain-containing protein [Gemmatimonadaceae bacterium]|jgi:two-component system, sensor histidine kinase and response regulator|nr:Hpt domain-containing protein [Gemmatimonadaceae bacterium]